MECRNCPYIKEEFKTRYLYNDTEEYCWCDKTGGKLWWYGYCSDAFHDTQQNNIKHSCKRKRNKRERDQKYKQHLKFLAENCKDYPSPAYPADENGNYIPGAEWHIWFPDEEPKDIVYYKRQYRAKRRWNRFAYYKKYSNRRVRRYKGGIHKGGAYKKIFDYWYEAD